MNKLLLGFVLIFLAYIAVECDCAKWSQWKVTLPPLTTTKATKKGFRCDCSTSYGTQICASNGITYKSDCLFQCAKKRVPRLRIVKSGSCSGISRENYWQKN